MSDNNQTDSETPGRPPINKKALKAFVLASVSVFLLFIAKYFSASAPIIGLVIVVGPICIAAIILGIKSYRQIEKDEAPQVGKGLAGLAIVMGGLVILTLIVMLAMMIIYILGNSR